MNDEIKEILIKDFNEILVPEFTTDWKEKRFYIQLLIETMPLINLLDYITDLQQINKNLTSSLNKKVEEGIELQIENERLKENKLRPDELVYLLNQELVRQNKDYKSRNDKAIELIKMYDGKPVLRDYYDRDLLNILQGSDKE